MHIYCNNLIFYFTLYCFFIFYVFLVLFNSTLLHYFTLCMDDCYMQISLQLMFCWFIWFRFYVRIVVTLFYQRLHVSHTVVATSAA